MSQRIRRCDRCATAFLKIHLQTPGLPAIRSTNNSPRMRKKTSSQKKGIRLGSGTSAVDSGREEESVSAAVGKPSKRKDAPRAPRKNSSSKRRKALAERTSKVAEPSDDEIRTRAYFIAERRLQLSLRGDEASDWIEARKQLMAETTPRNAEGLAIQ